GRHKKADVDCLACHETVYDAKTLEGDFLPKEAKCLECHKQKKADGQCNFCHLDVQHAATWPKREPRLKLDHAAHIERVKEDCSQCHSRLSEPHRPAPLSDGHAACLKCHDHAQQYADAKCATCQRCHSISSCETCHERERVSAGLSTRNPHPPGWALPGSGAFHGDAARRNIQSCAACHDQGDASNCVSCHKVGGIGGDPHPAGFLSHHSLSEAQSDGRCRACHF